MISIQPLRCALGFHDWRTISLIIQDDHVHQHARECRCCEVIEIPTQDCIKEGLITCRCFLCQNPPPPIPYCTSVNCGRPVKSAGQMCNVCWGELEANTYYPPSGYINTAKELRHKELISGEVCLHNSCPQCHGTGTTAIGTPCIHNLSCPCPKCSPR